jgi:DNA-directed RNA polymerase sigma subunit (sigma70/sigma32)
LKYIQRHPLENASMTHKEIAKILGVSKQMVFRIEKRALRKLKERCEELGITKCVLREDKYEKHD